jgi:hypothetical protein
MFRVLALSSFVVLLGGLAWCQAPGDGKGKLPAGVSVRGDFLKIARVTTFRRITDFHVKEIGTIHNAKIAADGSKIILAGDAGTFVLDPDGTNLVQLSDKTNAGLIDISADGKKVAWYEGGTDGLCTANADGTGKIRLPVRGVVGGLRLTAKGDKLFTMGLDPAGIFVMDLDGENKVRLVTAEQCFKLMGIDAGDNLFQRWPSGLDISDDGSRIVFHFLHDAFAVEGDGSNLRILTPFEGKPQPHGLAMVRISGDGKRIAWHLEKGEKSTLATVGWDHGCPFESVGPFHADTQSLALSRDASKMAASWGLRLYDNVHQTLVSVADVRHGSAALDRLTNVSLTADGKRALAVLRIEVPQLVLVEFEPRSLEGFPALEDLTIAPKSVTVDGTVNLLLSVDTRKAGQVAGVGVSALRDGLHLKGGPLSLWLNDKGEQGDAVAQDGIYTTDLFRLDPNAKVAPGPFTLRVFAVQQAGHVIIMDVEGVRAR